MHFQIRIQTTLGLLAVTAAAATLVAPARADRIVTTNGQTIEGILRGENDYNVNIDVRGSIVPIPRDRIKRVEQMQPAENLRMLLDHGFEALSHNNMSMARSIVEQARAIQTDDADAVANLRKLDQQITEMEEKGGTPEERRHRAETLLQRANEAYDMIRTEEGNQLIVQALKADPSYRPAHERINEMILKNQNVDLMLVATYFSTALYPDNLSANNPAIPLLPRIYTDLASRFDQTTDMQAAQRYVELLKVLNQAFAANPAWLDRADADQRALIVKPLNDLMADRIGNNLDRGEGDLALLKLQAWAKPQDSAQTALLYTRAQIAVGDYAAAAQTITQAKESNPDNTDLRLNDNAMGLLAKGRQALDGGDQAQALDAFQQVYRSEANLLPEIRSAVGMQLASLLGPKMMQPAPTDKPWQQAEIAALVMAHGATMAQRRNAAQVLSSEIHRTPWALDFVMSINGVEIALGAPQMIEAVTALNQPLGIRVDPNSSFHAKFKIDMQLPKDAADRLASALAAGPGQALSEPAAVQAIAFSVDAAQPTLGDLFHAEWTANAVPQSVLDRRMKAATQAPALAGLAAAPAPVPADGAPEPVPTPEPAPTPAPAEGQPDAAAQPTPAPAPVDGLLVFRNTNDIDHFLNIDLAGYVPADVALLTSHLKLDMLQLLLTNEAILK